MGRTVGGLGARRLAVQVPAPAVQADFRGQLYGAILLGRISAGRSHGEDEPSLTEAHPADQDRLIDIGQHDHVADVDVTGYDHILHK